MKWNEKPKKIYWVLATIVVIALPSFYVGYWIDAQRALAGAASTEVEDYSYLVYRVGGYYYAKNGGTGNTNSDNNATRMIINILIGLTKGTIFFKANDYVIDSTITINLDSQLIKIAGESNTQSQQGVRFISSSSKKMFVLKSTQGAGRMVFQDVTLDGNNLGTRGISIETSFEYGFGLYLDNVQIANFVQQGITDIASTGLGANDSYFEHTDFFHNAVAVDLKAQSYTFTRVNFGSNTVALRLRNGNFYSFLGCVFTSNTRDIDWVGTPVIESLSFYSTWFENSNYSILASSSASYPTFLSLTFANCRFHSNNATYFDFKNIKGLILIDQSLFSGDASIIVHLGYSGNQTQVELRRIQLGTPHLTVWTQNEAISQVFDGATYISELATWTLISAVLPAPLSGVWHQEPENKPLLFYIQVNFTTGGSVVATVSPSPTNSSGSQIAQTNQVGTTTLTFMLPTHWYWKVDYTGAPTLTVTKTELSY